MKILLSLFLASSAFAGTVKFQWDKSDAPNATYKFYSQMGTNVAVLPTGTNTTVTLDQLTPGQWRFWVTAISQEGIESGPSTVLPAYVPSSVSNFQYVVLEYTEELGGTNWIPSKYYRIRTQ